MLHDLVHAMPFQFMFALSLSLSMCVCTIFLYDNELTFVYRYILLWLLSLNPNFKCLRFIDLDTLSYVLDKCLRFSLIKIESVSTFNNQAMLGSIYPLLYILSY